MGSSIEPGLAIWASRLTNRLRWFRPRLDDVQAARAAELAELIPASARRRYAISDAIVLTIVVLATKLAGRLAFGLSPLEGRFTVDGSFAAVGAGLWLLLPGQMWFASLLGARVPEIPSSKIDSSLAQLHKDERREARLAVIGILIPCLLVETLRHGTDLSHRLALVGCVVTIVGAVLALIYKRKRANP